MLGFRKDFEHALSPEGPEYVGLSREEGRLHLSSFPGDSPIGIVVYIYVNDVDTLYAAFKNSGLTNVDKAIS